MGVFSTFGSKINEFERKKSEKNEKILKTLKLQAITLASNSHKFFKYFTWKIKIINFYCADFFKLLKTISSWK